MINQITEQGRRATPPVLRATRRHWLVGLATLALLCCRVSGWAQAPKFSEYEVKAAFLLNFLQFIEWPAVSTNAPTPLVIGVLGENPFGSALDETIKDETVQGRPLKIKRARQASDLRDCQLIFVCRSEKNHLKDILATLNGGGALTVSDIDQFCQHGGMIGLVNEGGRIRFEINQESAAQSNVKISSKLLRLARPMSK